jgi:hypothetical protein
MAFGRQSTTLGNITFFKHSPNAYKRLTVQAFIFMVQQLCGIRPTVPDVGTLVWRCRDNRPERIKPRKSDASKTRPFSLQ